MSLIEGFGDDFLYVLAFLGFIGIVSLAWFSTNVSQLPFPPTLFIIERRTRRRNEEESERSSPSPSSTGTVSETVGSSSFQESDNESTEQEENNNVEAQTNPENSTVEDETNLREDQSLKFVIKFLNDTQRSVSANPNDTISKVKESYFADELASNKIVRFIYQGRELQDRETLNSCNIREQTIIHCQITARRNQPNSTNNEPNGASNSNGNGFDASTLIDSPAINLSAHFVFLLTLILILFWYLRIRFRLLFSPFSTIVLIVGTILFLIFTLGSFFTARRTNQQPNATPSTILLRPVQHVHLD